MKNKLYVAGIGPGDPSCVTKAVTECIKGAYCIFAAQRHIPLAGEHKNIIPLENFTKAFERMETELQKGSVVILVSGDPGIYSLMPLLKERFPKQEMEVLPGISSLQCICAAAAETWNDAVILSGHGRSIRESKILDTVDRNRSTVFFCGTDRNPMWLCALLAENGFDQTEVIVGERLSYHDQKITRGKPSDLAKESFDTLSIVLILNASPWTKPHGRPLDEDFIRTDVPMTRESVRSVIIDTLRLAPDSVLWDIGAGTGSVSVAAGMICTEGEVHAVEINHSAAELEKDNIKKFHLYNVHIHEGGAIDIIQALPVPTHVFIGGSGDDLPRILKAAAELGGGIRIVVSAVTLKTVSCAQEILDGEGFRSFDAIQVGVSRLKKLGGSAIMAAQNPVTILSAVTASKKKEGL